MSSTFNGVKAEVQRLYKRRFIRLSLPFFTLVIGGSFLLKNFTQVRYTYSNNRALTPEVAQEHGIQMKNPEEVTLETQYEEIKKINIENWENKRIPRPWDETAE